MRKRKFWFSMSGILAVLAMALMLPAGAVAAGKYKVLRRFKGGEDGAFLTAGLIFDASGNLYGTTIQGGAGHAAQGCGIVFKLTPNSDGSWTESVLYHFAGGRDGCQPSGGLIFDAAGKNLYGTTAQGGNRDCNIIRCGVVFELSPNSDGSWTESVLHRFSGADGSDPTDLMFDAAGNLYGTTAHGGYLACNGGNGYGCGTFFKLKPNANGSWTETVLYTFCSNACTDGSFPNGLIFDGAGNLYGTTGGGGTPNCDFGLGCGTVFMLTANSDGSWTYSVLHSFTGDRDGSGPSGGLIFDAVGKNLYGTTVYEGSVSCNDPRGCGTVFKLTPNSDGSWEKSVLHFFLGKPAWWPGGGLVFDKAGNLYGTTFEGGDLNCVPQDGCGVVFKLAPNSDGSWKENVLHVFHGKPAREPNGPLFLDQAGNLYGTTYICGSLNDCRGVVFEVTP
jgi:uncharacterized repeat protein (TIGR03803 family)